MRVEETAVAVPHDGTLGKVVSTGGVAAASVVPLAGVDFVLRFPAPSIAAISY